MSDYVQPYGEADPNAPYKDRNTGAGQPGSKVPALAIEMPQREIRTVIVAAGLAPDRTDPTQLNAAIDQKIALATAGGENPLEDLLTLLRARLRIYPEILTADGRFNLTVPSTGNVRIPSGIDILHRGVHITTTVEQNFTTAANKTYHLRYRWTGGSPGWALVDVANAGYNASALAETSAVFDSDYDDMLAARVVTDASNVAAITMLTNKDRLLYATTDPQNFSRTTSPTGLFNVQHDAVTLNWARTPKVIATAKRITRGSLGETFTPEEAATYYSGVVAADGTGALTARTDRYSLFPVFVCDLNANNSAQSISFQRTMWAEAT